MQKRLLFTWVTNQVDVQKYRLTWNFPLGYALYPYFVASLEIRLLPTEASSNMPTMNRIYLRSDAGITNSEPHIPLTLRIGSPGDSLPSSIPCIQARLATLVRRSSCLTALRLTRSSVAGVLGFGRSLLMVRFLLDCPSRHADITGNHDAQYF